MPSEKTNAAPRETPKWLPILAILLAAGTLLALIPVLAAGYYSHPFGDDYVFGQPLFHALQDGTSLLGALFSTVRTYWRGWQGTFTGVIAMELMPDTFLYRAYMFTPLIMIFLLTVSSGKLWHTLVHRILSGTCWHWLALWAGTVFLWIQYLPSPAQGLYWWNGSSLYTLFFACAILLLERLITLVRPGPKRWRKSVLIEAALLAIWCSGGNYVTGLLAAMMLGLFWLGILLWERSHWKEASGLLVLFLIGFLLNVAAPGNAVRQSTGNGGMSAVQAVLESLKQGVKDCLDFPNLPMVILLILLLPVLWDLTSRTHFSFPWPLGAAVLAFLLFAALNTPHFYSLGTLGPGRIRNLSYFFFVLILIAIALWFFGWLHHRFPALSARIPSKALHIFTGCAAVLTLIICLIRASGTSTAGMAAKALQDNSLALYHVNLLEREALYRDSSVSEVWYTPVGRVPQLFYVFSPDGENPEDFPNSSACNYYRKDLVCQKSDP